MSVQGSSFLTPSSPGCECNGSHVFAVLVIIPVIIPVKVQYLLLGLRLPMGYPSQTGQIGYILGSLQSSPSEVSRSWNQRQKIGTFIGNSCTFNLY